MYFNDIFVSASIAWESGQPIGPISLLVRFKLFGLTVDGEV